MKNYKLTKIKGSGVYRITLPKTLTEALGHNENSSIGWKLHPNGKDLILEFSK